MITDIAMDEKKNEPNEELLEKPLRGILKSQGDYIIEDKFIRDRVVYICLILFSIFIIAPIMVCVIALWV